MRFTVFTSILFTLAATVSAVPLEVLSDSVQDLAVREPALGEYAANVVRDAVLEARKKYRAGAYTLGVNLSRGSKPSAAEIDIGKRAMCDADVDEGIVVYGWHGDGTKTLDKVDHFTIQPKKGNGSKNGMIHVHKDGSWTQGDSGTVAFGKGC